MAHEQLLEGPSGDVAERFAGPPQDLAQMQLDLLPELFDDRLLTKAHQQLEDCRAPLEDTRLDIVQAARLQVQKIIFTLRNELGKRRADSGEWEWTKFVKFCLHHPIRDMVYEDPLTRRAHQKPRGYAGDAVLMDFIYDIGWTLVPADTTALGRAILGAICQFTLAKAIRERKRVIADTIDRLAAKQAGPKVLSVAAGHLREADMAQALKRGKIGRWVAMDSDTESLQEVQRCYGTYGVEVCAGTVRQLLFRGLKLGEFDLIYSTGLYDYLQPSLGKRLTQRLFEMLHPGGQLVIANLRPDLAERGLMESYMDWNLIYRDDDQMQHLASSLDTSQVRDQRLMTEKNQGIVFLQIIKR